MDEEELVSEFTEKRNMLTLGWVSTLLASLLLAEY